MRGIEFGGEEVFGIRLAQETCHLQAMRKRGDGTGGLERLTTRGREQNAIEREGPLCGLREGEVPKVRWVEAASEECDTLCDGGYLLKGGWLPVSAWLAWQRPTAR